jgi:hypothetical protein
MVDISAVKIRWMASAKKNQDVSEGASHLFFYQRYVTYRSTDA